MLHFAIMTPPCTHVNRASIFMKKFDKQVMRTHPRYAERDQNDLLTPTADSGIGIRALYYNTIEFKLQEFF